MLCNWKVADHAEQDTVSTQRAATLMKGREKIAITAGRCAVGTPKPVPLTQLGEGEGETAFKGRGSFTEPGSVDGWSYPEFEEQHILSHISGQTWLCVSRGQTPSHSTLPFFFFLASVKIASDSLFVVVFNSLLRTLKDP